MIFERDWATEFSLSPLATESFVEQLDSWVRAELGRHHKDGGRRMTPEAIAPWSVSMLVLHLKRFAATENWMWATMSIALLQELIFCAKDGGIETSAHVANRLDEIDALRAVRNALMHPASVAEPDKKRKLAVLHVADWMSRDASFLEFAPKLRKDWSYMSHRLVTIFALRRLTSSVRDYAQQNDLRT